MRKLRFKRQVYARFIIAIAIISITAFFFYRQIHRAIDDSRILMHTSLSAIALVDTISRQNNSVSFEMVGFLTNGDTAYVKNIKNEQFAIATNLTMLTESLQEIGMGTLAVDHLQTLLERRNEVFLAGLANGDTPERVKLEEVKISGIQAYQQLSLLKQAIVSKRENEMEQQNSAITQAKYITVIGLSSAIAVLFGLIGYIIKTFDFQKNAERFIRNANANLSRLSKEKETDNWILIGLATLDDRTRGGLTKEEIALNAIQMVCQYLDAKIGLIYLQSATDENSFIHAGSYAATTPIAQPEITKSQGLIGECLTSKKQLVLSDLPENYLTAASALGSTKIEDIVIQPLLYEEEVLGVMEIGFLRKIDEATLRFLDRAGVNLAVACKVSHAHGALSRLYEETQQQAEELEAQQEELRTTNDELTHKTHLLEASEEELRVQQEELRHANLELEEKAKLLEDRNFSIEQARQSIAMKAKELEQSGKYKSEFLANMSHELRTPLNSILILAKLLQDNKPGNLLPDQIKYASVIYNAGSDLLNMINNILDLAKIESGSVELIIEATPLSHIAQDLLELFSSIADNKAIEFQIAIHEGLPVTISTDEQRLKQILKNLLSNAFKFTKEQGRVQLLFTAADQSPAWKAGLLGGITPDEAIAFSVTDTGIGIAEDKQQLIFDAFRQADGSTSRKYGGTGLGLSICRDLANLLGGEIHVMSKEAEGSTFTLFLPRQYANETVAPAAEKEAMPPRETPKPLPDHPIKAVKSQRLLIIEDDVHFAEILESYAREHGFEPLISHQGDAGLQAAFDHLPDAIILDIVLPVMDGWTVLKKLKSNPDTKDIPVHLMSADRPSKRNIEKEAVGFLKKPVDKKSLEDVFGSLRKLIEFPLKRALVIEDHEIQSDNLKSNLVAHGVDVKQAFTGTEAIDFLKSDEHFDCIILDINLPDRSGMDLLDEIRGIPQHANTPIIINTAMEFNSEMTSRILHHTKTMVVKSDKANNRILDEVNLFIHKVKNDSSSPNPFRTSAHSEKEINLDNVLRGKHVLLADDDMRNIFALSTVFVSYGINVETANTGQEALDVLEKHPNIDLVLMDIMMPEMDGYEAIAKIRTVKQFAKLPIIAITAKAMQDDRQRALNAGANDYITKPVDASKLLSLMRVWLS